ncbi:hypothetical protein [Micromonospora sp. NPDC005299]|uniref:hypothetical protein n=1 Tax=Micromonospora sp. NPDC005299 TaxID=3364231 RepID=UPI0036CB959D
MPITTQEVPGRSRSRARSTAWYGVSPASVSGAAWARSRSPTGSSREAGTTTWSASPPSRLSPTPPAGTTWHWFSAPRRQARQPPHPMIP